MIRTAVPQDIKALQNLTSAENHVKENNYFERCFDEQARGAREVILIYSDDILAGYCQYQRHPQYQPFRSLQIPEIQDVYIHSSQRRKGLAASLIEYCCEKAKGEEKDLIGIGVSVSSDYGKAQKLYFKLGFEPDGGGAVYDRKHVVFGQSYPVDDALCLMLIKRLD